MRTIKEFVISYAEKIGNLSVKCVFRRERAVIINLINRKINRDFSP